MVPCVCQPNFIDSGLRHINDPVPAPFGQHFSLGVPKYVTVVDLCNGRRVYINRPVPELVVEPFKRKCFVEIIITKLIDVACDMKRFPRPGIIAYVKMDFQIFV